MNNDPSPLTNQEWLRIAHAFNKARRSCSELNTILREEGFLVIASGVNDFCAALKNTLNTLRDDHKPTTRP